MRALAGVAAVTVALACTASAAARTVVPIERTQQLARGIVRPVGDELVRDSGFGDLLLAWREGRRVRASVRPDGGRFAPPRTIPGLYDAIANDSLTEPFLGAGGHLLWGWRPGAGDTSRMLVANGLGGPVQALPTNPASVALGPLSREADVGPDGHAAIVLVSGGGLAVAVAGPDARFSAPQQIAPASGGLPIVRVGRGGATVVAWTARAACASGECTTVQAALRPPGGDFGPAITLDEQPRDGSLSLLDVDAGRAAAVVVWRRKAPGAADSAIVLARGSFAGLGPGVVLPGTGDAHTDGRCPPSPSPGSYTTARIVALRRGSAGGLLVLLGRNEGCGILLDELAIAADGTPGAPRRLTTVAFSADVDAVTMLDSEGPRPALVARTTAGRAMVARAVRGRPLGTPAYAPLPRGARLGAFGLLRGGALALAFSRTCARAERVSDVILRPRRGPWRKPVRVGRCGDPEPVLVDSTGRAVFAQVGLGVVARSSAPIERYTGRRRGGRSQRSGR